MKSRLRGDLAAAMKRGEKREATVIRGLIAAIDDAEAPPASTDSPSLVRHDFQKGSAEVERLFLTEDQVRGVVAREIETREETVADLLRLGKPEAADALQAEAFVAKRYLDQ